MDKNSEKKYGVILCSCFWVSYAKSFWPFQKWVIFQEFPLCFALLSYDIMQPNPSQGDFLMVFSWGSRRQRGLTLWKSQTFTITFKTWSTSIWSQLDVFGCERKTCTWLKKCAFDNWSYISHNIPNDCTRFYHAKFQVLHKSSSPWTPSRWWPHRHMWTSTDSSCSLKTHLLSWVRTAGSSIGQDLRAWKQFSMAAQEFVFNQMW